MHEVLLHWELNQGQHDIYVRARGLRSCGLVVGRLHNTRDGTQAVCVAAWNELNHATHKTSQAAATTRTSSRISPTRHSFV
jgi:hypothetical protein